ncbi:Aspartic proteinase-like protein 2 [Vitis vinifera]|uniref:Aspartic proteinase-like protein 2 n=1 Tax=Vitis vinifera TaxID=29760 RepID=A0A438KG85_VITVI|nr:Aspartic proteinase-like protein 2 [Vitis vinifera]
MPALAAGILAVALVTMFWPPPAVASGFPATLTLERAFPLNQRVELDELKARDRSGMAGFCSLQWVSWIFRLRAPTIRIVLGFILQECFWVLLQKNSMFRLTREAMYCGSVAVLATAAHNPVDSIKMDSIYSKKGILRVSLMQIPLNFFDPGSSSTASLISCSDQRCSLGVQSSDAGCSSQGNQCIYTFQYGDGSGTSGYYVSDLLNFDAIVGSSVTNSSASIVFGCSISQTGDLTKSDRAVDGIFGFGQQDMSVISQMSSQGITPKVFSHCLKGDGGGGGILVLGEIVEEDIVYSPLVPSHLGIIFSEAGSSAHTNDLNFFIDPKLAHYNLNLQSISVNGKSLAIDPEVFATSTNRGTIVDSGTTLAYLAEEAYDPFVSAITEAVSQSVRPLLSKGTQCYLITSSVKGIFPTVSLNFAGGVSMNLKPEDYLLQQNSIGDAAVWCIGFQKIQGQGITILGDLVLKDKIFVYDLAGQRIGWANYDCSMSVNVSTRSSTGKSEFVNAGQLSESSSPRTVFYNKLIPGSIVALLVHLSVLYTSLFL